MGIHTNILCRKNSIAQLPPPKKTSNKNTPLFKKKSSPGDSSRAQTSSPIVGGHLTSPLEFGSRFHSPSQKRSRLESPGLEFFRTPKKPEFFFFRKGALFSRFPTRAVREGGRGLGRVTKVDFFLDDFLKQIFDPNDDLI